MREGGSERASERASERPLPLKCCECNGVRIVHVKLVNGFLELLVVLEQHRAVYP